MKHSVCIVRPSVAVISHFIPVTLSPSTELMVIVMMSEPVEGFGSQDTPLFIRRSLNPPSLASKLPIVTLHASMAPLCEAHLNCWIVPIGMHAFAVSGLSETMLASDSLHYDNRELN